MIKSCRHDIIHGKKHEACELYSAAWKCNHLQRLFGVEIHYFFYRKHGVLLHSKKFHLNVHLNIHLKENILSKVLVPE